MITGALQEARSAWPGVPFVVYPNTGDTWQSGSGWAGAGAGAGAGGGVRAAGAGARLGQARRGGGGRLLPGGRGAAARHPGDDGAGHRGLLLTPAPRPASCCICRNILTDDVDSLDFMPSSRMDNLRHL